jgi:hypothetical protein
MIEIVDDALMVRLFALGAGAVREPPESVWFIGNA